MKKRIWILTALLWIIILCGCEMRTVDQMYAPPKRSDDYYSLQTVISASMEGLEYSAPIAGNYQQVVQTVDLNGDDVAECLLFAKGGDNLPLHILIFTMKNEEYVHIQTIDLPGSAFDRIDYAPIDDLPGMEIVVGTQVSDQVCRSVSVYSLSGDQVQHLMTEDYLNFLTVDLDLDNKKELFVLLNGSSNLDRGVVELFSVSKGIVERSVELNLSETADNLKRILLGQLQDGNPAVYVACSVDDDTLITDVFALKDGAFTNVSLSSESGTSVKTMRNYFVYAEDIDVDGIVELPSLISMRAIDRSWYGYDQKLIRWYSLNLQGEEVDKMHTYHNFNGGWYVQVDNAYADRISVVDLGSVWDFYIWDQGSPTKVMSIRAFTGENRDVQSTSEGRFVLYKTESVTYAANLDDGANDHGYTQESVLKSFHVIE